ncbi:MAG: hypothetical protein GDA56_28545 [Hormoscilla sp. GM7CHS1pb]|nr:hypothetical protein [Hormoscilla sp. GM7CHS1pb]
MRCLGTGSGGEVSYQRVLTAPHNSWVVGENCRLRYALGFKDQALIEGAVSEDATRTTAPAILEHMQSFDLL